MVQVSDNFMELAQNAGRHIYCKINVGGRTFLDDRITEFDFDDVIHPDWVTIGTTCANRFAFSVRYDGEIAVGEEVRPYISFDNEEWCPLGVFFVARRYIRGNYASIICYDKMYSLDISYRSSLCAPASTTDLIAEICSDNGLVFAGGIVGYEVNNIPADCTVRDMIGYLASMERGCAKFDREGKLCFKIYHGAEDFFLYPDNIIDYSRNMTVSLMSRFKADTESETLESGSGGELSTIEFYNPFMTQRRLDNIKDQFQVIQFCGADIKMQGMPFLESGDVIRLFEKSGTLVPLFLSEIEYHYDGSLTARVYSKAKSYTDAAAHQDDLEAALAEIKASLGNIYKKQVNSEAIALSTAETTVADFEFSVPKQNAFAQADLNFTANGAAGGLVIKAYVNGAAARTSLHTTSGTSEELIHFYHLAEELPKGNNRVVITVKTTGGGASIGAGRLLATLVTKGTAGGEAADGIRDRQVITQHIGGVSAGFTAIIPAIVCDSLSTG